MARNRTSLTRNSLFPRLCWCSTEPKPSPSTRITQRVVYMGGSQGVTRAYESCVLQRHRSRGSQSTHLYPPSVVPDPNTRTGPAQWTRTLWKRLEVGDLVLLRDNEKVPADLIALTISDPDGNRYLETKTLDTRIEAPQVPRRHARHVLPGRKPSARASSPTRSRRARILLYPDVLRSPDFSVNPTFWRMQTTTPTMMRTLGRATRGALSFAYRCATWNKRTDYRYENPTRGFLSVHGILPRGCALRKTTWVVAAFTGAGMKIVLKMGENLAPREDAKGTTSAHFFDIGAGRRVCINAVLTFLWQLVHHRVPEYCSILLYISIEIVKTTKAYFISQDVEMYYIGYPNHFS
ncbi:hypothetical protein B0H19DRAFT_1271380 [Mycena capillaripes]|nr:hypothetical protein B0H19DRAFT_1271380 [Mycena capillaripes]